jgi:hypothetical protein
MNDGTMVRLPIQKCNCFISAAKASKVKKPSSSPSMIKGDRYEAVKILKGTFDVSDAPDQGSDCRFYW